MRRPNLIGTDSTEGYARRTAWPSDGNLRIRQIGIRKWNGEVVLRQLLRRKQHDRPPRRVEPEGQERVRQLEAQRVGKRACQVASTTGSARRVVGADQRNERQLARLVHGWRRKHVVCPRPRICNEALTVKLTAAWARSRIGSFRLRCRVLQPRWQAERVAEQRVSSGSCYTPLPYISFGVRQTAVRHSNDERLPHEDRHTPYRGHELRTLPERGQPAL